MVDIEINKDNYQKEIVENPKPTVVDFWGPQCARCLELMPVIEEIAQSKKDAMRLVKIDATKNRRLCMGLKLMRLPAFLFYRGGKEFGRISGDELTETDLRAAVDKLLSGQGAL
jgi:thioredoxin-like negative regulator of GroEL